MDRGALNGGGNGVFRTTRWTIVLEAGGSSSPDAQKALSELCEAYWQPIYCCIRRKGHSPADAEDLTQGFFEKILSEKLFDKADKTKGRFRTFLLRCLENYLKNEYSRGQAKKRGGGCERISIDAQSAEEGYALEPADNVTPELLFERRWAVTLLNRVMSRLREEYLATGTIELFNILEPRLWGEPPENSDALASRLGVSAVGLRKKVSRMRSRAREIRMEEIAQTVGSPEEIASELDHLRRVLAR